MKYAIVIPDGAADEPQESLGGKTPLEAAQTPNMDRVVAMGVVARACHTPKALPAGSEIGNLSLLGYNPFENFTGRAPMEAAAQGIKLGAGGLGGALQSGHDRRPGDARFHGRPHQHGGRRPNCWRPPRSKSPATRNIAVQSSLCRASATATCCCGGARSSPCRSRTKREHGRRTTSPIKRARGLPTRPGQRRALRSHGC